MLRKLRACRVQSLLIVENRSLGLLPFLNEYPPGCPVYVVFQAIYEQYCRCACLSRCFGNRAKAYPVFSTFLQERDEDALSVSHFAVFPATITCGHYSVVLLLLLLMEGIVDKTCCDPLYCRAIRISDILDSCGFMVAALYWIWSRLPDCAGLPCCLVWRRKGFSVMYLSS